MTLIQCAGLIDLIYKGGDILTEWKNNMGWTCRFFYLYGRILNFYYIKTKTCTKIHSREWQFCHVLKFRTKGGGGGLKIRAICPAQWLITVNLDMAKITTYTDRILGVWKLKIKLYSDRFRQNDTWWCLDYTRKCWNILYIYTNINVFDKDAYVLS